MEPKAAVLETDLEAGAASEPSFPAAEQLQHHGVPVVRPSWKCVMLCCGEGGCICSVYIWKHFLVTDFFK